MAKENELTINKLGPTEGRCVDSDPKIEKKRNEKNKEGKKYVPTKQQKIIERYGHDL
jgi:hypothetical protein